MEGKIGNTPIDAALHDAQGKIEKLPTLADIHREQLGRLNEIISQTADFAVVQEQHQLDPNRICSITKTESRKTARRMFEADNLAYLIDGSRPYGTTGRHSAYSIRLRRIT